ncbi:hypothetical protein SuNHUV7_05860 (plasmid) [Pseudoseohaeicola sp. NH-UV-7]|uniref:hypothetical protein n=1 Tax=Sulfitobacter sp. TBRI5 TaxID=2989732 RepID=UPI003A7022E5
MSYVHQVKELLRYEHQNCRLLLADKPQVTDLKIFIATYLKETEDLPARRSQVLFPRLRPCRAIESGPIKPADAESIAIIMTGNGMVTGQEQQSLEGVSFYH